VRILLDAHALLWWVTGDPALRSGPAKLLSRHSLHRFGYTLSVEPTQQLGRLLLSVGAMLFIIGALFYFGRRLPFRLGRLPGDIIHRGEHGTFYFPLVSCLVISVGISLILWLINHLRR